MIDWANVYGWFGYPKSRNYLGWSIDPKRLFENLMTYKEVTDRRLYHGIEPGNKRSEDFGVTVESIGFTFIKKEVKWVPVYLNEENHFKMMVKNLFDVLDGAKTTNSDIANNLYTLKDKIENSAYELIGEQDKKLKKLNDTIGVLQQNLLEPVERRKCDFDVEIARDALNLSNNFDTLLLFSGDGDYAALVEDLISKGKKIIVVFAPGHKGKEYEPLQVELRKKYLSYALFICNVEHLKDDISVETNIPTDFSAGRDSVILAGTNTESQAPVDNK
jgi:uncharacterized LabA/DUF88 family protein